MFSTNLEESSAVLFQLRCVFAHAEAQLVSNIPPLGLPCFVLVCWHHFGATYFHVQLLGTS
jgi:hypothetical protein